MASSLQSDMDAFKAANPLGKLEDFIRWYSPVDWVESVDGNYHMASLHLLYYLINVYTHMCYIYTYIFLYTL